MASPKNTYFVVEARNSSLRLIETSLRFRPVFTSTLKRRAPSRDRRKRASKNPALNEKWLSFKGSVVVRMSCKERSDCFPPNPREFWQLIRRKKLREMGKILNHCGEETARPKKFKLLYTYGKGRGIVWDGGWPVPILLYCNNVRPWEEKSSELEREWKTKIRTSTY